MAKKKYDVAERFQEVTRRARAQQEKPKYLKPAAKTDEEIAYETRPGRERGPNTGKDVNLPYEPWLTKRYIPSEEIARNIKYAEKKKKRQGPGSRVLRD